MHFFLSISLCLSLFFIVVVVVLLSLQRLHTISLKSRLHLGAFATTVCHSMTLSTYVMPASVENEQSTDQRHAAIKICYFWPNTRSYLFQCGKNRTRKEKNKRIISIANGMKLKLCIMSGWIQKKNTEFCRVQARVRDSKSWNCISSSVFG